MIRPSGTPVSWGIEDLSNPRNAPWERVLDEIAAAGYEGTELGELGFLPETPSVLRAELDQRQLALVAGYVHCPLDSTKWPAIEARAQRICEVLSELAGRYLVIIDERAPERLSTAGNSAAASRLRRAKFAELLSAIGALGRIAEDCGITPVVHHHAAGYLEFRDEIEYAFDALADGPIKLCIDTGHAAYAGMDPVTLYNDFAPQVAYLHLKDIDPEVHMRAVKEGIDFWSAVTLGIFCPLGEGIVDFPRLARTLEARGYDGWATIEQDRDPTESEGAASRARRSLSYLREAGIIK